MIRANRRSGRGGRGGSRDARGKEGAHVTSPYNTNIYVLMLEKGKYYVGKSNVPESRILNHFKNNGSAWTSLHKPIRVVEVEKGDIFDEDKITKQYML